jgi:hypothetical protein
VFDPRRVLNNPSFFLSALLSIAAVPLVTLSWKSSVRPAYYFVLLASAFALPLLLGLTPLNIDFEQGRYDSARTLVGIAMLFLSLAFASTFYEHSGKELPERGGLPRANLAFLLTMLAVGAGSAAQFAHSWTVALGATEALVKAPDDRPPTFIPYREARLRMSPRDALLNDQMDFQWVMPFRSIVLANGSIPGAVVYHEVDLGYICSEGERIAGSERSRVPRSVNVSLIDFACSYEAPNRAPNLRERMAARINAIVSAF